MQKNLINFTPIGKQFLVEVVIKDKTESGIMMLNGAAPELGDSNFKGYLVLATGPLCSEVCPGDTVIIKDGLMGRQTGMIIKVDGLDVTLVSFNEYDIFAIRADEPRVTEYTWKSTKLAGTSGAPQGSLVIKDN